MSDIKIRKEDQKEHKAESGFAPLELWRKLFRISVGTMVVAQEEAQKVIDALIEQGELAEKEGKRLLDKLDDKQRKTMRQTEERGEEFVEDVLDKLQIPSRRKIDQLEQRIAELSAKLDQLQPETTEPEPDASESEASE